MLNQCWNHHCTIWCWRSISTFDIDVSHQPGHLLSVASIIPPTHDASSICRPASRRSFRSPALLQVQPLAPCWIYACHGRCNSNVAIKHWVYSIKRILWLYFWLNWWNNPRIKDIQWTRTCIVSHVHQTLQFASHIFEQCAWGIQRNFIESSVSCPKRLFKKYRNLQHFLKLDRNNCHGPWFVVLQISHFEDAHYCLVISTYFNALNKHISDHHHRREDLNEKPSTHDTHDPSAILKCRYRSFPMLPYASLAPVEAVSGEDIGEDLSQLMGAKVQEEVALRQVGQVARLVNRPEEPVVEPASTWGSNSSDGIFECFWIISIPVNEAPSWLY